MKEEERESLVFAYRFQLLEGRSNAVVLYRIRTKSVNL